MTKHFKHPMSQAKFRAGETLLWRLDGATPLHALDDAQEFSGLSAAHSLGECGYSEIGLGGSFWFDLVLSADVPEILIKLIFEREPDERY